MERQYLTCERNYIFELLIFAAGMMGAYTLILRGGVFCNAQTANLALMAVAFGTQDYAKGLYYLIPISAYFLGIMVSEWVAGKVRKRKWLRWDTILIAIECMVLLVIGWIPLTTNHHYVQITINFICAMQFTTFRSAESVPMATTFCTAHVRQTGVNIVRYLTTKDKKAKELMLRHGSMLLCFTGGAFVEALACGWLLEKAVWLILVPLGIVLLRLIMADRGKEQDLFEKVPLGH